MAENKQTETAYEEERLRQTIAIAEEQLQQARRSAEEKKAEIIEAKKEMRENTVHGILNLWSSEDFEALAELNQYANPVTDKIVGYEEEENKILLLENMVRSPYFARIDFQFEGEEAYEQVYIGHSSLKKGACQEMYVYDWRSPIASVFYRFMTGEAFYEAPCGRINGRLGLKRQYEIKDGVLEYFFDADVQVIDEFLRQLLSQNTSAKMKSIVETIQKEQDIVIRDMENDLLMVQGVAGSGKTSIALHRAAYLMYQGLQNSLSANNIMILSPNTVFEQYISHVLPELGESNVVSAVFEDILSKILHNRKIQTKNELLERLLTDRRRKKVIKSSIEWKTSAYFKEILERFLDDIPRKWIAFEDIYYDGKLIIKSEKLREKILGRKETPLAMKLRQLEDHVIELIFGTGRKQKNGAEKNAVRQKLQEFTKLDVIALYKKLFDDKEYFYGLLQAGESVQDEISVYGHAYNIGEIRAYTRKNLESSPLFYDDAIAIAYLCLKIYGVRDCKDIKQVVIDEAQDYYPLQYEILALLFSDAKFTVLGDMHQTLAKKEDLSLYEQIQNILEKKTFSQREFSRRKSSLITLDKSFRCTNEILNFSLQFITHSPKIKSFNRSGDMPVVVAAKDRNELTRAIVKEVNLCREKGFHSVGLLCKTERNAVSLYKDLKSEIDMQLIRDDSAADLQGTFIIPLYMAKGLEFDAVILCDADRENYEDEDDRNLLYIACTRALHRLTLICEGEKSLLIESE